MAETLEQIYFNTALGATELDDGEHTIVTTDANTRYVIKDVLVKGNEDLTANTYLELNGFNIGSLNGNSSGSLIVPPSSTLKIKTTDFPFSFYEETQYAAASGKFGVQSSYYSTGNTSTPRLTLGGYATVAPSSPANVTDAIYTVSNAGAEYFHYTRSDNNSAQQVGTTTLSNNSDTNYNADSYTPYGVTKSSAYGTTVWHFSSNGSSTLNYSDLLANPTGASWQSPSNIGGGARSNSYSPSTGSSYPRADCHHGYFFYIPNSGYSSQIYGINLTNGAFLTFNFAQNANLSSQNANFTVAYDPVNDKFIFYRSVGTTSIARAVFSTTKTTMDAVTTNASYSSATETLITIGTQSQASMTNAVLGYDYTGNVSYRDNSSYALITVNSSGTEVSSQTEFSFGGNTIPTSNNYPFNRKARILSVSEATSLGLVAPTIGVQILGVKSVV